MSKKESKVIQQNQETILPILLTPRQAAIFLSVALPTLNNSRYLGIMSGVKAPAYIKRGKSIFYKRETLVAWSDQFEEQNSTSENVA